MNKVVLALSISCWISFTCHDNSKEIPHFPVQTALGELVETSLVDEITVNDRVVTSGPGCLLLMLKFRGKTEIPYRSAAGRDDYYTMIDSTEHSASEYVPFFVGAFDANQKISDQQDWKMNGTMTVRGGEPIFSGTIRLARPEVVLLYSIPSVYHDLYLRENGKKLPIFKNHTVPYGQMTGSIRTGAA